jgi:hypothetical protein
MGQARSFLNSLSEVFQRGEFLRTAFNFAPSFCGQCRHDFIEFSCHAFLLF